MSTARRMLTCLAVSGLAHWSVFARPSRPLAPAARPDAARIEVAWNQPQLAPVVALSAPSAHEAIAPAAPETAVNADHRVKALAAHRAHRRRHAAGAMLPAPVATPASSSGGDGALERTLQRVAATKELSNEQKRRAMLALLRTWEGRTDPETAERIIDGLLAAQPQAP
jgi:hypothetical protein